MTRRVSMAVMATCGLNAISCLPADTRPEPARVVAEVDLPADLREGRQDMSRLVFGTEDGWTITIDRLLVSAGRLMTEGEKCNPYSDAWYLRVLDLLQPGPQRLGQVWALNDCRLSFGVDVPDGDAVLGSGVTEADRTFMQQALVTASLGKRPVTNKGMAVYLLGSAAKDTVTVNFEWGFSGRSDFVQCQDRGSNGFESRLPLIGGGTTNVSIAIDPRNLFRVTPFPNDAGAPIEAAIPLMQAIADADQLQGNANGRVSLDELGAASAPDGTVPGSLGELIRWRCYPSMFLYGNGGRCTQTIRDNGEEL